MRLKMTIPLLNSPKPHPLLKSPQFLCNHYETWSKLGTHGLFILTKFRNDSVKIVDFLIKAYFRLSLNWDEHVCTFREMIYLCQFMYLNSTKPCPVYMTVGLIYFPSGKRILTTLFSRLSVVIFFTLGLLENYSLTLHFFTYFQSK